MIEIKVIPKKWGNSLGFVFPSEIVKKLKIRPGKKITAFIVMKE